MYHATQWEQSPEYRDYLNRILAAIADETQAAEFYGRLQAQAPTEMAREYLEIARKEEMMHRQMLSRLYFNLTGMQPAPAPKPLPKWNTFAEGLQIALDGELAAQEEYRKLALMSAYPQVRDMFFDIMGDEIEHSIRFTRLFAGKTS
ncbi:MAG: ferritin-like domain-containing protein [Heliobacteriaceae bacterium]|nr:ferritin-like domain-containing protein [Heliobacteriaceae bacterium]MDD4588379.1 ferritin-like domain-containing protein [Heliobacteriaceae bacterium]